MSSVPDQYYKNMQELVSKGFHPLVEYYYYSTPISSGVRLTDLSFEETLNTSFDRQVLNPKHLDPIPGWEHPEYKEFWNWVLQQGSDTGLLKSVIFSPVACTSLGCMYELEQALKLKVPCCILDSKDRSFNEVSYSALKNWVIAGGVLAAYTMSFSETFLNYRKTQVSILTELNDV